MSLSKLKCIWFPTPPYPQGNRAQLASSELSTSSTYYQCWRYCSGIAIFGVRSPCIIATDRSSFQKLSRSLAGAGFRRYVDALALKRPHYKLHRAPRARGIDYTAAVVRDLVSYTGPLAGAPPTQPQVFELAWRAPRSNAREAGVQAPH